jgi:putative N6-adenine-specific DNA methylase
MRPENYNHDPDTAMALTSFEKRIKRRIIGREHPFFLVCSPGLKTVCTDEMGALGFPEKNLGATPGGIEFNARLTACMELNLNLRSPSRLLMRVAQFKADTFDRLEKKIAAVDWSLYLPQNALLKFNVTARKSRLYHSDAIAQRSEPIIQDRIRSGPALSGPALPASIQTIFIRADQDVFTLSLDSTGDLLHKRGIKQEVNIAPLRETLAFAMLHWAGFSRDDVLVDPMCGSGSFSLEAAMIKARVAPGFFRSFAFESWPGFSPRAYAHMKKQSEALQVRVPENEIFASDMDEGALAAMEKNRAAHDFTRAIDLSRQDFFSLHPSGISTGKRGVVMLNPPYGKRLGNDTDTRSFFREIGKKLKSDFKGWRAGIILPSRQSSTALGLKLRMNPIFHGGLDLFAGIGRV